MMRNIIISFSRSYALHGSVYILLSLLHNFTMHSNRDDGNEKKSDLY